MKNLNCKHLFKYRKVYNLDVLKINMFHRIPGGLVSNAEPLDLL